MSVILNVLQYPSKELRNAAEEVTDFGKETQTLVEQMRTTLNNYHAVGLAAPQVGMSKRIVVIDYEGMEYTLINPVITKKSDETIVSEEMCLSFIGVAPVKINRAKAITVEALDMNGEKKTYTLSGMVATIFQHEIDHLDGVLLIDHLSPLRRGMVKKRIDKLHKKSLKRVQMLTR